MMKPISRVFFTTIFLLILAGCGSSSTPSPTAEPTPLPTIEPTATPFPTAIPAPVSRAEEISQQAFVRLIQGSWGLPEVDLYIDGAVFGYNVNFGQVTEPQPLVSGQYTLRLMPAGVALNSHSQEPLLAQEFTLPAGETLTLIIGGEPSNLNVQVVPENTTPLTRDTSRVTLIHALHQGGGLGVKVNQDVLIAPIGAYQISHDAPINDLFSQVQIVTPEGAVVAEYGREFRERVAVTLVMIGDASIPESVQLVYYTNRVYGDSQVQFVNVLPEQSNIDIYLDGQLIAGDVGYTTAYDVVTMKPADYRLEILPAGASYAGADVIYRSLINLYEDESVIIVLTALGNRVHHMVAMNDLSPTPVDQSRIRFIHGANDGVSVDAIISDLNETLYDGDVSRERLIPANLHMMSFDYADNGSYAQELDFIAGSAYTIIYVNPETEPIVISGHVGVEEASQSVTDETQLPPETGAIDHGGGALVYLVNLVGGENLIDVSVGNFLIQGVPNGNLVSGGSIPSGQHQIQAYRANTDSIFSIVDYSFQDGYFYTIYVVGLDVGSPFIHIFEHGLTDSVFDQEQAIVQFLNLSLFGSDVFLVGLGDGSVQFSPLIGEEGQVTSRYYSVAGDFTTITASLLGGQVTYPQYLSEGSYQVVVLDANTDYGIGTLPNLNVQARNRYDVIIQQDINTEILSFVVVVYPAS